MSLQVWLPLTGNLNNQGLSTLTFSNTNTSTIVSNDNGKIGKCYERTTKATAGRITSDGNILLNGDLSMCCWAKVIETVGDTANGLISNHSHNDKSGFGITVKQISESDYRISCSTGTGSDRTYHTYYGTSNIKGAWHHLALTYNNTSHVFQLWVDGVVEKTQSYTNGAVSSKIMIFEWSTTHDAVTYRPACMLNDVRFYDHCLSEKEVKNIARGIVLHYPLDRNNLDPYTGNLIFNGFGELGTTNWATASKVATDDLPTADTAIKARFIANNNTLDYIPIYRNHNYSISLYVKASSTSGSCYPSLIPYDIDKLQITWPQSKGGFNLNTMTTLKQQLKAGDTKIYVNDLSAWSTAANWQNYAAIFGYKDSTGYTYPDGVYTRTTLAFWSGNTTEKTSLDKTNNIITLSSAYTGATIPAGRSICASSAGAVYYYPFGGIANSGIADWTYKSTTFSSETNYLSAAKYVRFSIYSTSMGAGITLKDITPGESNLEYDISGCQRNGTRNGNLTWDTDSPRYKASTHFTATNQYIRVTNLTTTGFSNSYSFSWWGNMDSWSSAMFWGFSDGVRLNGLFKGNLWNTGDSGNNPLYKPGTTTQVTSPSLNTWHHYVMVGNGTNCVVYLDGELWGQAKTYKTITGTTICFNGWDTSTSYTSSDMRISDFRIYATALSAQDVKDLYNGLF